MLFPIVRGFLPQKGRYFLSKTPGKFRVGTSGYQYDHWKGTFYPEDINKKDWFNFYADKFDTVEINNTFYNLPEKSTFENWKSKAPEEFCYVLKFSRFGSHLKKLKDPENSVGNFLARANILGSLLGPILVQLPPGWHVNPERLDQFLSYAPKEKKWALEFRDPTWLCDEVYEILSNHDAALCIHDMIENHPEIITTDWTYFRFHGRNGGDYPHQYLSARAEKITEHLSEQRDVWAFFNNDAHGYAVENALDLRRYVTGQEN